MSYLKEHDLKAKMWRLGSYATCMAQRVPQRGIGGQVPSCLTRAGIQSRSRKQKCSG